MKLKNIILFIIPSLIWGSTWLAIKFQLGVVDPLVSVVYRFFLASAILLLYCRIMSLNLKFTIKEHLYIALLGIFLFGTNYWLVYLAEINLPSGMVAVVFSSIIFLNIIFGAIFLKSKIRLYVVYGAIIGLFGIGFIFHKELLSLSFSSENSFSLLLALIAAALASFGNITSAFVQKKNLPVIQTNAFAMFYGPLSMLIICLILGKSFSFDISFSYIGSLLYLAIFGSIVAFSTYLTLLGTIGADKSAYVTLVIPVIALIFSTIFENYRWNMFSIIGVLLILAGNTIILKRKKA
jgi:drug/metabolite transporter (DMT)-like permease